MLAAMRWRAPATPVTLLALAALLPIAAGSGCGAGAASFREIDAGQGRELVAREGAQVVQVGHAPLSLAVREGARVVEAGEPWPPDLAAGPVVIVAAEPEEGYRLAARMARAGIQEVAVVAGGVEAWNRERALARSDTDVDTEREGDRAWPKSPM